MSITGTNHGEAFAVWVTGMPASGKSTLTAALREALSERGIRVVVLESDELRRILVPAPTYEREERDRFYQMLLQLGACIVAQGVPVILDATAHRRQYRRSARRRIGRFAEVFVDCPLEVCRERDPKGIYRRAEQGLATTVPGMQIPFEVPESAEVTVRGDREAARSAARRVVGVLDEMGFLDRAERGAGAGCGVQP